MTREEAHTRLKKLVDDFFDGLEAREKPEMSPAKECQASFQSLEQYSWMSIDARETFMFHAGVDWLADWIMHERIWEIYSRDLFNRGREEGKR